ncbi:beta-D-glucosyl crocetin beta-1,6-glucosyltransferase-like [Andrographis paniculata]|uniref:beta-D-glucosyl crocetin beta-1,6-glucosyltransferase-like n=1 Tax=Andrographis paniculata TaxID=175694 RepID=UPI0021E7B789|nr:beta-D-glucosyl crocetin beta-1,6-glucosyltransferase-like [Andrographis paniculata]
MESPKNGYFKILMFPWLAHGHIFPYLELAKTLTKTKNFHIYICSTAINSTSIIDFIDKNSLNSSLQFIELKMDPSSNLPPHYHTTKNLPSHLNTTLIKSFQTTYSSFDNLVHNLNPNLVIFDVFQPWASKIAAQRKIPSVYFSIYGAMLMAFMHHRFTFPEIEFPFPDISLQDFEMKSLDLLFEFLYENVHDGDRDRFLWGTFEQSRDIVLLKTTRGIEGKYLDYLSTLCNKKLLPVGPLISDEIKIDFQSSKVLQWLENKSPNSTLFISFGSEYFLSKIDVEEIAKGLELCEGIINFIWIIRFPAGSDVTLEEYLPLGFLDRAGDRGIILTGWAPQAEILAHRNTGGFMSHCGWSSIVESMYYGVPVVAMPMKVDQPINAKMLVEAGSAVEVRRNENEGFKGEEIAKAIKKVFFEETGDAMRRRARKLRETMKIEKETIVDEVALELWELCLNNDTK